MYINVGKTCAYILRLRSEHLFFFITCWILYKENNCQNYYNLHFLNKIRILGWCYCNAPGRLVFNMVNAYDVSDRSARGDCPLSLQFLTERNFK